MNKLPTKKRVQDIAALVEGCSIRSTVRMTGVAKNTVFKLLCDMGKACRAFHDDTVKNLPTEVVQCDEIWSFVGMKEKNVPKEMQGMLGAGDVWTWTALDSESKLMISWLAGKRDAGYASIFMEDVASRLANRVQLTTDGHGAYLSAVRGAFGNQIDYSQLVKQYGAHPEQAKRYSPAKCMGTTRNWVSGFPDADKVSISHIERSNLTMRMAMRRFTRLTNAFSKKLEYHEYAISLHSVHYNFCRIHQTLRMTPAMACALADRVWSLEDLVGLLERYPDSN